ncbi:hypothetical protein H8B09_09565 [Paenibacillus sp. PR3]|uniref:DUF4879 domain-containing protein n=1 Tax=Paenibacillus terricola TaxID=2763503 RepID=A0ABR8MTN5_9BACL|nr:hypothetical protein [Paenibacillus terricola]MBD3919000.1 hypothetical protein [Paenibacillus terricola]
MKLAKKYTVGVIASVACLAFAVTAFANTSTTSTTGYGTLKGSLTIAGTDAVIHTTVSYNNDNAYLTDAGSIQDINGATVATKAQVNSSRGETSWPLYYGPLPSNTYVVYGTHGVQGGNTYGASAVYTYTHI